jgi:1-acyl-sn-glycerol-3-phosphate acyltransferase
MIPATISKPHRWLLRRYLDWIFRQDFQSIQLLGPRPSLAHDEAVLLPANHTSWWDAFFALLLAERVFDRPMYTLALEDTVRRFAFFNKVGCYGFNPKDGSDVRAMLRYTAGLLDAPQAPIVLYFPEGRITPNVGAPYVLRHGLRALRPEKETLVVPLYITVQPLNERKPTVFLALGEPFSFRADYKPRVEALEDAFESLRRSSHEAIARGDWGETLVGKRPAVLELAG